MTLGTGFWANGPGPAPRRCDVAIVGAGYTGLSAALALAEAGQAVTVFDCGRIGDGASSRNAGFCTVNPPFSVAALAAIGPDAGRRWMNWFECAVDHVEALAERFESAPTDTSSYVTHSGETIGFRRSGALKLAETTAQARRMRTEVEMLGSIGIKRRYLDVADLRPPLADRFVAARHDTGSATLNPGALHRTLAKRVAAAGATILEDCSVTHAYATTGGIKVVHRHGSTQARRIVVATNGYTNTSIAPFRDFILSVGSFIMVTEPFAEDVDLGVLTNGVALSTAFRFPHYFRLLPDRRLLFGGRSSLSTAGRLDECATWLHGRAEALFPTLDVPKPSHCWGGRLGFTFDKRPLLGRLDECRYYAMGCAGHGVPTSLSFGREVADHILGRPVSAPFWREPASPPARIAKLFQGLLPLAQAGLKMRDAGDAIVETIRRSRFPVSKEAFP